MARSGLHAIDWAIVALYTAAVVTIGWRASRGQKTVESHLRANRSLPTWALIFSVLAAEISAATYIGVPEKAYVANWNYLQFAVGALLGKWVLSRWFVKLYWRLNLATVYGFLGQTIGPVSQRASAWTFLGGRLVASGVRMFIAAVALEEVTGFPMALSVALMAAISTVYTFLGGLRAVVWTDVAQGAVFVIGALAALLVGLAQLDLPLAQVVREAWQAGKLQTFTLDHGGLGWLASTRPFPVAVLGGFLLALAVGGTDQESVQHLLNSRSEKASGRTIFGSGLLTFPVVALFLSVGTMLWAYAQHVPGAEFAGGKTANVFPSFARTVLPIGVRGLVFAGLFAAAISFLGATLNALTTTWITDIRPAPAGQVRSLARVRFVTCVFGALLLAVALFFAWYKDKSGEHLIDIALSAMTILYGGILGGFLTALLFPGRGNDRSVPLAMAVGVLAGALLFFHKELLGLPHKVLEWPWSILITTLLTVALASLGRRATGERTAASDTKILPHE
jgi:solute:Na+ symporter, SSS family